MIFTGIEVKELPQKGKITLQQLFGCITAGIILMELLNSRGDST